MPRLHRTLLAAIALSAAQQVHAQTLDDSIPSGANFDKAQFRLWTPRGTDKLRAVLVLVPGSNGDGRAMAEDTVWQAFATRNKLAIIACRFTDKQHDQGYIEDYVNVSHGSGQALLDAIDHFAARSGHKEIASARSITEATARQQARAVYKKAGLGGRNDLAAFFLEDLLLPRHAQARATAT